MESALEVLSRAATMVNNNSDNRITINKELPTTKWRRDRRIRLSSEYHHSNHNHEPVGTVKPLGESNQSNSLGDNSMEIPLDMSVGASKPPPPPYRDPLPGSTFCTTMSRPSVITQAPKREVSSNQENKQSPKKPIALCDDTPVTESISMIDPVIDEHFRRSLGADYMNLFGKRLDQLKSTSSATATIKKSPQISPIQSVQQSDNMRIEEDESSSSNRDSVKNSNSFSVKETVENIEMSVDDHFAKALGDTWKQLQQNSKSTTPSTELNYESDVNSDPDNDSNVKDEANNDEDEVERSSKKPSVTNDDSSESQSQR